MLKKNAYLASGRFSCEEAVGDVGDNGSVHLHEQLNNRRNLHCLLCFFISQGFFLKCFLHLCFFCLAKLPCFFQNNHRNCKR